MNLNEYRECVLNDAENSLIDCFLDKSDRDKKLFFCDDGEPDDFFIEEILYDLHDDISGNCDGSYYCNRSAAIKELRDVIFDPETWDLLVEYSRVSNFIACLRNGDPEGCDVILRDVLIYDMVKRITYRFSKYLKNNKL